MGTYSKLIVAVLGAVIIALNQFAGINIGVDAQQIVAYATPILTALGVWKVTNG